VWLQHWGLTCDPFTGARLPYVHLPSHDEAVARLMDSIERPRRFICFVAEAGLGKTTVLRRVIAEARNPRRRFAVVQAPSDGEQLLGRLADGLGLPFAIGTDGRSAWRSLARAVRVAALEGSHVVFAIDGWDVNPDPATLQSLAALLDTGGQGRVPPSLIRVGRLDPDASPGPGDTWTLAIGLQRLTRSQAETYLDTKLAVAGGRERIFTTRAMTRLHCWSEGVPRGLDQLSASSLMAAAMQGLEVVSPDVVDSVAVDSLFGVNSATTARSLPA
jgi:general secretion pathway protein A